MAAYVVRPTAASATSDHDHDHAQDLVLPVQSPLPASTGLAGGRAARDQVLTRREIEGLVAEGHTLVILDGYVLKLDKWLEKHPGGRLPLLQMVGVDATCEIKA